jgi:hypothetical protein
MKTLRVQNFGEIIYITQLSYNHFLKGMPKTSIFKIICQFWCARASFLLTHPHRYASGSQGRRNLEYNTRKAF